MVVPSTHSPFPFIVRSGSRVIYRVENEDPNFRRGRDEAGDPKEQVDQGPGHEEEEDHRNIIHFQMEDTTGK